MRAEFLTNLEINYLCKVLYYKARTELDNAMASDSERIDTLHRRQNYLELKRVWCRTRTNDRIELECANCDKINKYCNDYQHNVSLRRQLDVYYGVTGDNLEEELKRFPE